MASLAPVFRQRFFDSNGDPLAGGKLYTYVAGTTVLISSYQDADATIPNANPVVLDANGEASVFFANGNYKVRLDDANDVTQWTLDDISVNSSGGSGSSDGWSALITHNVTDGQSATDLASETFDTSTHSSVLYDVEILRGTTVLSRGFLAIVDVNGTATVVLGPIMGPIFHGVTFSVNQVGTVAQLRAALDVGAGSGTIKLSKRLYA